MFQASNMSPKPSLADNIESWTTYMQVFNFILDSPDPEIALTAQWVSDIIVEFVYQFQGFCQYRSQTGSRSPEEIRTLESNRQVWTLPAVMETLKKLTRNSNLASQRDVSASSTAANRATAAGADRSAPPPGVSVIVFHFGYFAAIERARLECLLGDYTESLATIRPIRLQDRSELFNTLPQCHVNLFYHAGICQLMLRRYADAIGTLGEIALHISRIMKQGNQQGTGIGSFLKKMSDKTLALTAMCVALTPGMRVDDQVRELLDNNTKFAEKIRRLHNGEHATFTDMIESTCPKFIAPAFPDFSGTSGNLTQDFFSHQLNTFIGDVQQHTTVLKLRSYLKLYASIDIAKLARFSGQNEQDLMADILSFKHKLTQLKGPPGVAGEKVSTGGVHYYVQDGSLIIDTTSSKGDRVKAAERHFVSGVRKHNEISADVKRSFKAAGL